MPESVPTRRTLEIVKEVIRQDLKLSPDEPIPDTMPLLGGDLDLDSLDVLMLLTSLEKRFGLKIPDDAAQSGVFKDVTSLALFVERHPTAISEPVAALRQPSASVSDRGLDRLPHREPFLFISRILDIRPGESGEATWDLDGSEPFFAGHFPGRPVVPGVLLAESLAQLSGVVAASESGGNEGRLSHLDVRFRQTVVPPAQIRLRSEPVKRMGPLHQFRVEARLGEVVVAEGSLALHMATPSPSGPPVRDRSL